MRARTIGAIGALLLAACGGTPPEEGPHGADTATAARQPGIHEWTTPDGNRMPYEVSGAGDVAVVLVHCWMCDRTFWEEQVPVLQQHYLTVALDLPGHGEATARRDPWTVEQFGRDVAGLLESLDLHDVVLVGHSMGGPVCLKVAALAPGRVRGIVAVDTLQDAEFEFSGEQVESYMRAFEADYAGTCDAMIDQMFPEANADAAREHVRAAACQPDNAEAGVALMRDFGKIDMETWFSEAGVPLRAVNATGPNPTRVETNRKYADFDAVFMDGVGHYLHMTRPAEFNPLLLAAIEEILAVSPAS